MSDEVAAGAVARAEPFLRLALGWEVLGLQDGPSLQLLEGWAARVGPACDVVGADVGPLGGRLRCWADGPSEVVIPVLAALFLEAGATKEDLDLVAAVGAGIDPARLGGWVDVHGEDRSVGWHLGRATVGQLLAWLPWMAGLDPGWEVRRWSRSVGPSPVDVVEVAVPQAGDVALSDATGALASCGVPLPADDALGALARHAEEGVGVQLDAVGGDIFGGGIDVATSDVAAVVDVLHALGCGEREVDRVARFRGAAGEPAIVGVGAVRGAAGPDAVVRLRLA